MQRKLSYSPFKKYKVQPALCLDFDGTVRRSKSGQTFIQNSLDIELIPGVERLIYKYREMNYVIAGITNQAGVAHNFKSCDDVMREVEATLKLFKTNPFHVVKVSFHDAAGKVEPFCHRSLFRKPDIGMLAAIEFEAFNTGIVIDWDKSLFVGDRDEDAECAKNARIPFRHIDSFLNEPHTFEI